MGLAAKLRGSNPSAPTFSAGGAPPPYASAAKTPGPPGQYGSSNQMQQGVGGAGYSAQMGVGGTGYPPQVGAGAAGYPPNRQGGPNGSGYPQHQVGGTTGGYPPNQMGGGNMGYPSAQMGVGTAGYPPNRGVAGNAGYPSNQVGAGNAGYPPQQVGGGSAQMGLAPQFMGAGNDGPTMHSGASAGHSSIYAALKACVDENRLHQMYSEGALRELSQRCEQVRPQVDAIARQWKLGSEIAHDFYKLALYDVHLVCDDSGSMKFQENGERIEDLKAAVGYIAEVVSIFDFDGINVHFLNSAVSGEGVKDKGGAEALINRINFSGLTPLGTTLRNKVLQPYVFDAMRTGRFGKPVLIICVTDGSPAGEPSDCIYQTIEMAVKMRSDHGNCVAFEFAQVGMDTEAQQFLAQLDKHPIIGPAVDVTSSYDMEARELQAKGANLTPELWIAKLLLGAIDRSYDSLDE